VLINLATVETRDKDMKVNKGMGTLVVNRVRQGDREQKKSLEYFIDVIKNRKKPTDNHNIFPSETFLF
jgi:hypothetical protein